MMAGRSQVLQEPLAAGYAGMGAYSSYQKDVFSFTGNQASLSEIEQSSAGIYNERKFFLRELNTCLFALAVPATPGNFGLKLCYSGFSSYSEYQAAVACGRKMSEKLSVGIQFNYYGINIAGYGTASCIGAEIGMILRITDELHSGIHISNPAGARFGPAKQEKIPSVYSAGMGYEPSQNFFFTAEIIKKEQQPVNVNAGIQYRLVQQLFIRAGVAIATSSIWTGTGMSWKKFRMDIIASFHPQLGISPALLLLINFKKHTGSEKE